MQRCRLHILGASGSGTTTLGRAVADHWSVPHADADDYFWRPSTPPYVDKRPVPERVALMHEIFVPREAWVLSGAVMGWAEEVVEQCDAIVFLRLDPDERLARLEAREERRRVGQAPDPEAWQAFTDWARSYDDPAFTGRSLTGQEAWLATVRQPVLRLDASQSREALRDAVLDWEPGD